MRNHRIIIGNGYHSARALQAQLKNWRYSYHSISMVRYGIVRYRLDCAMVEEEEANARLPRAFVNETGFDAVTRS